MPLVVHDAIVPSVISPPSITCLCPTRGRPELLANAIACFKAQEYPVEHRQLIVFDDLGTIPPSVDETSNIIIISRKEKYPSLPAKYNALWRFARKSDIYCVWEDDDIYLPWYLTAHAIVCPFDGWSKPSCVWSDYGRKDEDVNLERADGRFHASIAIGRGCLERLQGWYETPRADFDQIMLSRLGGVMRAADPIRTPWYSTPGYVFCWETGHNHGQNYMLSPGDETWYDRYKPPCTDPVPSFKPQFTVKTLKMLQLNLNSEAYRKRVMEHLQLGGSNTLGSVPDEA